MKLQVSKRNIKGTDDKSVAVLGNFLKKLKHVFHTGNVLISNSLATNITNSKLNTPVCILEFRDLWLHGKLKVLINGLSFQLALIIGHIINRLLLDEIYPHLGISICFFLIVFCIFWCYVRCFILTNCGFELTATIPRVVQTCWLTKWVNGPQLYFI